MSLDCLFCRSQGPFSTEEHVIPESLGNTDLILRGEVCDACQRYFGKEVERYVLSKTPIGFWRVLLGIRTKRGKLPRIDLSVPYRRQGIFPEYAPDYDNGIGFSAHDERSVSIDIDDPAIIRGIISGERTRFRFVMSPKHLVQIGRFLGKVALELLCLADRVNARAPKYNSLREYARFGARRDIWPIYRQVGSLSTLSAVTQDERGVVEEVLCYEYSLLAVGAEYELLAFRVGTDQWIISITDPFPTTTIRDTFPGSDLQLIWYPRDAWA
jgi:hypothetical protein